MNKSAVRNSISYMINDKIALSKKSSSSKACKRDSELFPPRLGAETTDLIIKNIQV